MIQGHGVSIKTIEAMSYGKPVIGTRHAFRGFSSYIDSEYKLSIAEKSDQFRGVIVAGAEKYNTISSSVQNIYKRLFAPIAYHKRYRDVLGRGNQTKYEPDNALTS
jgi:hypothetical protein